MRRGWDSNPRRACTLSGFQDRRIRPLCHPSEAMMMRVSARDGHRIRRVDGKVDGNAASGPRALGNDRGRDRCAIRGVLLLVYTSFTTSEAPRLIHPLVLLLSLPL